MHIPMITGQFRPMVAVITVAGLVLAACQPNPAPTPLRLTFAEAKGSTGSAQWSFTNRGDAALHLVVRTAGGGTVTKASGRTGGDSSIRFPRFDPAAPAPRAVVEITNATGTDRLDPRTGAFEFGADFTLDATTADLSPASTDDGDNLVQRGRYDDVTQYKLEIDHRQPICRVKGRSGDLTVFAGIKVAVDRWYRARCRRVGGQVTVTVWWWNADGSLAGRSWSKSGATGDLTPASAAVPISLGGKLAGSRVDPDADQFNGRLDNVYVHLG